MKKIFNFIKNILKEDKRHIINLGTVNRPSFRIGSFYIFFPSFLHCIEIKRFKRAKRKCYHQTLTIHYPWLILRFKRDHPCRGIEFSFLIHNSINFIFGSDDAWWFTIRLLGFGISFNEHSE